MSKLRLTRRVNLLLMQKCRVATSLCRLLFETMKVNDALLFMTILSTDLKALKRRGYNGTSLLRVIFLLLTLFQLIRFSGNNNNMRNKYLKTQRRTALLALKRHMIQSLNNLDQLVLLFRLLQKPLYVLPPPREVGNPLQVPHL